MLAPILVHTAEEAWEAMGNSDRGLRLRAPGEPCPRWTTSIDYAGQQAKWQKLMDLRDEVLRTLEGLRQDKAIASNQEASVTLCVLHGRRCRGVERLRTRGLRRPVHRQRGQDRSRRRSHNDHRPARARTRNVNAAGTTGPPSALTPTTRDLCERCASCGRLVFRQNTTVVKIVCSTSGQRSPASGLQTVRKRVRRLRRV